MAKSLLSLFMNISAIALLSLIILSFLSYSTYIKFDPTIGDKPTTTFFEANHHSVDCLEAVLDSPEIKTRKRWKVLTLSLKNICGEQISFEAQAFMPNYDVLVTTANGEVLWQHSAGFGTLHLGGISDEVVTTLLAKEQIDFDIFWHGRAWDGKALRLGYYRIVGLIEVNGEYLQVIKQLDIVR